MGSASCGSPQLIPFLKWAGGKRWLVQRHLHFFDVSYNRFIEPFLGSGAVFFRLLPTSAILSDMNPELINAYQAIRDDWRSVEVHLRRHHRLHSKEYYYKIRSSRPWSMAGRAAKFIYLNRTCWNGLYRVNLNGDFNVPIGTKRNVVLDTDDFEAVASALSQVELFSQDFQVAIDQASLGDFVFVDPPYTVKHNHNGFIKYNESLFTWEDQIRLRESVVGAVDRGAKVLITNAYHPSIRELYKGIGDHFKVVRSSVISGMPERRGNYEEIVIKCF